MLNKDLQTKRNSNSGWEKEKYAGGCVSAGQPRTKGGMWNKKKLTIQNDKPQLCTPGKTSSSVWRALLYEGNQIADIAITAERKLKGTARSEKIKLKINLKKGVNKL